MQHVAWMLNAVFGCLFRGGKSVVPGAVEVLETICAIFQLITLTRYDSLLLGNTARGMIFILKRSDDKRMIILKMVSFSKHVPVAMG